MVLEATGRHKLRVNSSRKSLLTYLLTVSSWISQLDEILASKDLDIIAFDRQVVKEPQQIFHNLAFLEAYVEFISNFERGAETPEEKERAKKLKGLEQQASNELLNGIGLYCELVTVAAHKSSDKGR